MVEALLDRSYKQAMLMVASGEVINTSLTPPITNHLTEILNKSESAKAVLTVILTSLVYKKLHPEQDIRVHQAGMENGYSGRTFDTRYITPFLKKNKFPAMAESGWLTRSLEQRSPYNSNYSGSIRPSELKQAFLEIIDFIQKGQNLDDILSYILQGLIIQRNRNQINLAKPFNLPIAIIINHLKKHFSYKYVSDGAARLPVLALYAIYQSLIFEVKRYEGKKLLNLESHTSADSRSGRIGDIDVIDERGSAFEAVEVKHGIAITRQLVIDAYEKFEKTQVKRYYLLSTVDIDSSQKNEIECEVARIASIHGCHVIVNGLITSLNYYLRLLSDTSRFIEHYVDLLQSDTALKFEHKVAWNTIIAQRE